MNQLIKYNIQVFWDNEYKQLDYVNESFNDAKSQAQWIAAGYPDQFTGDMCDMRNAQPTWNNKFIDFFQAQGWKDIGTSYYRMTTGTVLPVHVDLYSRYIELFRLQGQQDRIRRAIVFLEDWKSGHYFEAQGCPLMEYTAGSCVEWTHSMPHMAANIGLEPRYTLQITGHV